MSLVAFLRDLFPRRLRCPYCEVTTYYGGRLMAHIEINHAGDRMDRCERSPW